MSDGSWRPPRTALLTAFERADPREPLTTVEVAEALSTSRRTAYNRLMVLADRGVLETKAVGSSGRVWWVPAEGEPSSTVGTSRVELTTDEEIEVVFESRRLAEPFFALGDEEIRIVIDGFVRFPDGSHVQYWTVEGLSLETLRRLPQHFPTNEDVRLLSKEGGTYRVEVKGKSSSLVSTYDDFGGESVSAILEDDSIVSTVRFPATVDPSDVLTAVRDTVASDFELVSQRLVYTPHLFRELAEGELTDRQLAALRLAHYAGYFSSPRTSSGDDLAERLGVTRQTFHGHLRRAEETLVRLLFDASAEIQT